jgi:hypothetical protein
LIPTFIEDWHFIGFYPFFGQFSAKLWLYDTDLQKKIENFLAKILDIAQNCYSGMPCATVDTTLKPNQEIDKVETLYFLLTQLPRVSGLRRCCAVPSQEEMRKRHS